MPDEQHDLQTYEIIGAAMEVHRQLGHGFLEAVYQEALGRELTLRNVPFTREASLNVLYKGQPLACKYKADFICFETVIVETKAIKELTGTDQAQVINYLRATGLNRALLLNFGSTILHYKRLVLNYGDQGSKS